MWKMLKLCKNHMGISFFDENITPSSTYRIWTIFVFEYMRYIQICIRICQIFLPLPYPNSYSKRISDTAIHIQKLNMKSDMMRIINICTPIVESSAGLGLKAKCWWLTLQQCTWTFSFINFWAVVISEDVLLRPIIPLYHVCMVWLITREGWYWVQRRPLTFI